MGVLALVDCNSRAVTPEEWPWADLVIASAMLVQKWDLQQQICLAKAHQLPVAVGGSFATSTPDVPELEQVDFLVLDEGELTIPLLEALARGDGQGRCSAAGEKPDISGSPVPRFELLELDPYSMMAVQFSRGCPFQCEFCDRIVLYGRKPRTKEPQQLLCELWELGWRGEVLPGSFLATAV